MITYNEYQPICLEADIPEEARFWRNHASIWKWCRQHTLIDEFAQEYWLARQSDDETVKMFGIYDRDMAHKPVGVCGFTSIDLLNRNAEFSCYIEPRSQHKGYGKKALLTLLRHGFEDWGFNRIWGETYEGNPALKMFIDIGMKKEGKMRQVYFRRGRFIDCHVIAILAEDWFRKAKPNLKVIG